VCVSKGVNPPSNPIQAMRTFILLFVFASVIGFGFGVAATSSAQKHADQIVESNDAQYCQKGFTEFCL